MSLSNKLSRKSVLPVLSVIKTRRRFKRKRKKILAVCCFTLIILFFACFSWRQLSISFPINDTENFKTNSSEILKGQVDDLKKVDPSVLYLVLSGQKTFFSRGPAFIYSWASDLKDDDIVFFTEKPSRMADVSVPAEGLLVSTNVLPATKVMVVRPTNESLERNIAYFNSWSHLVRLRTVFDRFLSKEPRGHQHEWIVLVDDDTFVFHEQLLQYLRNFNGYQQLLWMGVAEYVRIDNGDGGPLSQLLRDLHVAAGNEWCTLQGEEGHGNRTFAKCKDVFCKSCPWIPQGGFVVLSRSLVETLRPHLEECEVATRDLCSSCGSQRLYFCIQTFASNTFFEPLIDSHRFPWFQEPKGGDGLPISFHGFDQRIIGNFTIVPYHFEKLYNLVKMAKSAGKMVTYQDIANEFSCNGRGIWSAWNEKHGTNAFCSLSDGSLQLAPTSDELLSIYLSNAVSLKTDDEVETTFTIEDNITKNTREDDPGWLPVPFSRIYVLNRDSCKERWQLMEKKAQDARIFLTRFVATDFSDFTLDNPPISIKNAKVAGFSRSVTAGQVACTYSHMRIWQDIVDNNFSSIMILEDDVFFTQEALQRLSHIMKSVELGSQENQRPWHWIYFRRHALCSVEDEKVWHAEENSTNYITWACSSWGTSAYALSLQGAKFLLEHITEYIMPLDVQIAQLQEDYKEEFVTLSACKNGASYVAPCPETVIEFTDEEKGSCSYSASQMGDSRKLKAETDAK